MSWARTWLEAEREAGGLATHLSRTTMMIFSADALFSTRWALSVLHPAQSRPSTCRI